MTLATNFNVRTATVADATRLAVLAVQVWTHTYTTDGISQDIAEYLLRELTPEQYRNAISDASTLVFVAERGDCLIGFAVVKFGSVCNVEGVADTELKTLYIQDHFTGQGVGLSLLLAAQTAAQERGNSAMWLSVNATNDRAMAFYTRHGYRKIGTSYFVLADVHYENHVLVGTPIVA